MCCRCFMNQWNSTNLFVSSHQALKIQVCVSMVEGKLESEYQMLDSCSFGCYYKMKFLSYRYISFLKLTFLFVLPRKPENIWSNKWISCVYSEKYLSPFRVHLEKLKAIGLYWFTLSFYSYLDSFAFLFTDQCIDHACHLHNHVY
jgi:hypothetical protein